MSKPLAGKVCLVTGGTRGIGKGISLQLGEAGATVYVTGRTLKKKEGESGSLEETAQEIESRGGRCIPVVCDHGKDDQVEALFKQIEREQDGQLDILVNNAYAAVRTIFNYIGVPFWEQDIGTWDIVNNVGLRNHYLCTVYASRMMVPRKKGLIINISSMGGLRYLFNTPYGIGKQALDRMAADCGVELKRHNVAMVSLWPGAVQTETIQDSILRDDFQGSYHQPGAGLIDSKQMQGIFKSGESIEFAGKVIVHLAQERDIMKRTGRTLLSRELASEYGLKDIDGRTFLSTIRLKAILESTGWHRTAKLTPGWVKLPYAALTLAGSKF